MLEIKRFSFRIEPDFAPVWTMGDILDSLKNTQREHIFFCLMENSPIPWSSFFQPSAVSFTAFDEILSCHPYWPTGCSENSKGRGEFSKLFYLQSALIFYFVFDFSVLLLESPSSNRLDFGFELSALGSHWLLVHRLLRVCLRRRVEVSKQRMGEGTRGPLRSQCADWNHRWKWQAIKQCTNAAKAI